MDAAQSPEATDARSQTQQEDDYAHARKSKFRFKSSSKSRSRHNDPDYRRHHRHKHHGSHNDHDDRHHRKRHHTHHRHHRSHRRTKRPKHSPSPSSHDMNQEGQGRGLSPNAAFRESLFDALGDDEGAEYWESVYGQPIHTYDIPHVPKGPTGELEQMTEEEYAAYVRRRMWERTREGMIEAEEERRRERREKARREQELGERERGRAERNAFERAMEESLRRGVERKRGKGWRVLGEGYYKRWEKVNSLAAGNRTSEGDKSDGFAGLIFWPVQSGKRKDVSKENISEFIHRALVSVSESGGIEGVLKAERIRWHPDKIQHRYGALGIDEDVIRSVTEVFQIVDTIWNELKEKQG